MCSSPEVWRESRRDVARRIGLFASELCAVDGPDRPPVVNFSPRPAGGVLVGGGLLGGVYAGKTLVKFGTTGELDIGELGLETVGWGSGLKGGVSSDGVASKKGPSSALAGDGERLPGMGARRVSFIGSCLPVAWSASRIW